MTCKRILDWFIVELVTFIQLIPPKFDPDTIRVLRKHADAGSAELRKVSHGHYLDRVTMAERNACRPVIKLAVIRSVILAATDVGYVLVAEVKLKRQGNAILRTKRRVFGFQWTSLLVDLIAL